MLTRAAWACAGAASSSPWCPMTPARATATNARRMTYCGQECEELKTSESECESESTFIVVVRVVVCGSKS